MRVTTIPKVLLFGAVGAYVVHRARRGALLRRYRVGVPPPDPADPVQELYSEEDPAIELDTPAETTLDASDRARTDTGDLYGLHTPPAEDTTHPDSDHAMNNGQTWLEALATDSAEGGTVVEHELDIVDDQDDTVHPSSDTRDRPIADRGSGGPGGS